MPPGGGAVVVDHPDLESGQGPVPPGAQLDVGVAGRRGPADQELLAPGERDLDRPPELDREQCCQRLEQHHLAAEAAPDRHRNHPHLGEWQPQQLGDLVPDEAVALGRAPQRDAASRLGSGDGDVGLDEALVGAGHHEPRLDHGVGLGQAGGDVAAVLARD